MSFTTALNALGGLALFLLAMQMMTDGLKIFAGGGLRKLLARWTSTPLRGVFSGILVTGLVQSSSAVTVATIGFVNAGVLTLRQALGVIFGTNVGTTMTGWLVSLVGGGFKIEAFALPILTVGVVLRLAAPRKRHKGLGEALAGFGLFFLGLTVLKDAFGGMAETFGAEFAGSGSGTGSGWPTFLLVGFVATLLTQSSSAAIAIILTAAAGGYVAIEPAAGAVIGANLGTTTTAVFSVIKATSNAKRLALGHILFNLITAIVALILLPILMGLIAHLSDWLDLEKSPAATLALFHTVFNVLGVALLLPFSRRLSAFLEKTFRSAEEDVGKPRHLDSTLTATPSLAISALRAELLRLEAIVTAIAQGAALGKIKAAEELQRQSESVRRLGEAIVNFVAGVRTETMSEEVGNQLGRALQTWRHLDQVAKLAPHAYGLREEFPEIDDPALKAEIRRMLQGAADVVARGSLSAADDEAETRMGEAYILFEDLYHKSKTRLLVAAVGRDVSIEGTESILDNLSMTRRMVEQFRKAGELLRNLEAKESGPG